MAATHMTSETEPGANALGTGTPQVVRSAVRTPRRMAFERFMHNRMAVAGVFIVFIIFVLCMAAPLITHNSPTLQDLANVSASPSKLHPLGTDNQGMDYLARDLYGGRVDFLLGFVDTIIIMTISVILGGLAGFYGRWVDAVVMRIVDFMLNFPFLLLIIVLSSILNYSSVWMVLVVIACTAWAGSTRFVRGLFLNLRDADFILAARISGSKSWRVIFRHMLPNVMGPLVVNATFLVAGVIGTEAALAIIGYGVQPPAASWGAVLNGAQDYFTLKYDWWAWVPPAMAIFLTILSINFIGDGLRDAFDPSFDT